MLLIKNYILAIYEDSFIFFKFQFKLNLNYLSKFSIETNWKDFQYNI